MIDSVEQLLPGVHLLQPKVFRDERGDFVKTFHAPRFAELGIAFTPIEEFFSTSAKGVIRGMHFQLPPHDHDKLVFCIRGRILDVVLDLRPSSPCYRHAASAELSLVNRRLVFIPSGVAHGFLSWEDNSVMVYKTSTIHVPSHDAGIRWDSFGFDWGMKTPVISARDAAFPALAEFGSPFA